MQGFTSIGVLVILVILIRSVVGFREDYIHFKKEKFSLVSYYRYLKEKISK